ncbi:hypothetical protein BJ508DRAFT_304124 [Ascobolus immersus RN42]|uniref:Uncharacterized protein n=1 Tax=Ascobolus immersus RN42 TaxID=1160509 RepID=A0A3N4IES2_ASCIM|nr:hypothetical protein BJ508DRAFT_304124 [Ascobolus immersus RN42]
MDNVNAASRFLLLPVEIHHLIASYLTLGRIFGRGHDIDRREYQHLAYYGLFKGEWDAMCTCVPALQLTPLLSTCHYLRTVYTPFLHSTIATCILREEQLWHNSGPLVCTMHRDLESCFREEDIYYTATTRLVFLNPVIIKSVLDWLVELKPGYNFERIYRILLRRILIHENHRLSERGDFRTDAEYEERRSSCMCGPTRLAAHLELVKDLAGRLGPDGLNQRYSCNENPLITLLEGTEYGHHYTDEHTVNLARALVDAGLDIAKDPGLMLGLKDPVGAFLHFSARKGLAAVTRCLLDCGADVHIEDMTGKTAVNENWITSSDMCDGSGLAIAYERMELFKLLVERGADINGGRSMDSWLSHPLNVPSRLMWSGSVQQIFRRRGMADQSHYSWSALPGDELRRLRTIDGELKVHFEYSAVYYNLILPTALTLFEEGKAPNLDLNYLGLTDREDCINFGQHPSLIEYLCYQYDPNSIYAIQGPVRSREREKRLQAKLHAELSNTSWYVAPIIPRGRVELVNRLLNAGCDPNAAPRRWPYNEREESSGKYKTLIECVIGSPVPIGEQRAIVALLVKKGARVDEELLYRVMKKGGRWDMMESLGVDWKDEAVKKVKMREVSEDEWSEEDDSGQGSEEDSRDEWDEESEEESEEEIEEEVDEEIEE